VSRFDHYSLRAHGSMIRDAQRTFPLTEALRRHVGPDSVVLDVGTGTGIFAMMACQLGARRVFAIEPDKSIEVARLCGAQLPGGERIEWIRGLSTEVELAERADVVLGDLRGTLPFFAGNLTSMIDARRRLLADGGTILPRRDRVWVVPAQSAQEYRHVEDPWERNALGIDLSAGRRFLVNSWWRADPAPVSADAFLADPGLWANIDYRTVESPDAVGELAWSFDRAAPMPGYYVWFDGDVDDGLATSNSPLLPEIIYGRAFFPLERPVEVRSGDRLKTRFSARLVAEHHVMVWNSGFDLAGREALRFRQSSFNSQPLRKTDLDIQASGHLPSLTENGRIALEILQAIERGQSIGIIAAGLAERHAGKFRALADARERVLQVAREHASASTG